MCRFLEPRVFEIVVEGRGFRACEVVGFHESGSIVKGTRVGASGLRRFRFSTSGFRAKGRGSGLRMHRSNSFVSVCCKLT